MPSKELVPIKVVIAGGRDFQDYPLMLETLRYFLSQELEGNTVEIVSGEARGADKLGERLATELGLQVKRFPAEWDKYGKSAGYRRNADMASYSDYAAIFWDGKSKGTKHMIDLCKKNCVPVLLTLY